MSQGSSNSASPSRPVPASDLQETITPVSHVFGLPEVTTSLEALNTDPEQKPNVVHRAQAGYSPEASRTHGSPDARDYKRSAPVSPRRLKRYALQLWLEVEVGLGYFLPPEDDSFSTDFALEALNRAYPGCTGVYLDRGGHMLAFYSRKGSPKAGLIQDVAIEAGHTVTEIPTWMGLAARWRAKCISLAEAKEILAGCKRLKQETRRWECLQYQQHLASLHQPSGLSIAVAPFQPWIARPMPGPAEMLSNPLEAERRGSGSGLSPPRHSTTSSVGKIPPPMRGPYPQTSEDEAASDAGPTDSSSCKKGRRSRGNRGSRSEESSDSSNSAHPSPPVEVDRKRRMDFLAKSKSWSLVERRAT